MKDSEIIFSDLHGCFYTMTRLLNRAPKGLKIVFLGDLIDRGPNSRKVVEFAMSHGIPTTMGNHEDLTLAFYRPKASKCRCFYDEDVWLENGGKQCLRNWPEIDSAGLTKSRYYQYKKLGGQVPKGVLDWMERLPPYLYPSERLDENGRRLLASHSGYGLAADLNTPDGWMTALWGRRRDDRFPFATDPKTGLEIDDGLYRVFGHTRHKVAHVTDREACIDTGAAYGAEYGNLSALLWPSKTIMVQPFDETPCEAEFTIVDGRLA